ncbi:MAG: sigma-54 dependent transcriptional regulator [Bacteroidota bacterium]
MHDSSIKVFVVDDDEWYRKLLVHTLSLNPNHEVSAFSNGAQLLKSLKEAPKLITLDLRLPDYDGSKLFDKIQQELPDAAVIVISEQQDIQIAVDLLKRGAYDYLPKTEDIRDRLLHILNQFSKSKKLEQKVELLQDEVEKKYDFQAGIVGQSLEMKRVYKLLEKAAQNNINVLITGETGTGKEVVAKAIHYNGDRRKKAFIPVNMGAIPKDLAESELFGHEKGAFTGASGKHIGKFEQAQGGTLFLDEIGELEVALQAKLLRALQEREITRVGGTGVIKIDCRIIAATHQNLANAVKQGRFREDLYYRLFGLPIELPPLRDRDKDIILLARAFAKSFAEENQAEVKGFAKDALHKLMSYPFPGNIRELKSVVELASVMSDTEEIVAQDITFAQQDLLAEILSEELSMKDYQLKIIRHFLKRYDDIKKVAEILQLGQSTIYRLLKENPQT